jgi:hypothetical protein
LYRYSLDARLKAQGPVAEREARAILAQVFAGLAYLSGGTRWGAVQLLNPVHPPSLESAWFQLLRAYEVKNWFQNFAFKWVNLCRYNPARDPLRLEARKHPLRRRGGGHVQFESSCDP